MPRSCLFHATAIAGALSLSAVAGMVAAQSSDQIDLNQPDDSSGTFEISGVKVDASGPNADAARFAGWREAQRKGWQMLSAKMGRASNLPDGALDGMVAGIVIENEQIGPNRYIATLGVLFSRAKAAPILGVSGVGSRTLPMLTIPIQWSGGSAVGFEQKSAWKDAWDRFRAGDSAVDYVRPSGNGPDSLLLNLGQTGRRDRAWWRAVLDQYGSQDVLVPCVTLYRQWPGGPVIGVFEARHGPDNRLLSRFALKVDSESGVSALLDAGVKRIDDIYQNAMRSGSLGTDGSLAYVPPVAATPTPIPTPDATDVDGLNALDPTLTPAAPTSREIILQFDSPNSSAVSSTESVVRSLPGVSGAATTSLAIGGVSVMRLDYAGDPEALRSALESRGFSTGRNGSTLRIRRAPTLPSPSVPADNSTAG